jgi:hypothetical protein
LEDYLGQYRNGCTSASKEENMKRKTILTLVASAALCMTILPSPVSAMHGGHGGMGMHGGTAGGFRGGMSAGYRSAPVGAFHAGPNFRNGLAVRNHFAFRNRVFINNRFAFHHRFRHFRHRFFVASIGDDCFVVRQVWTPWGWRWRRVWACG